MVDIYNRIREFSSVARLSKHEQIVKGVLTSIEDHLVERGQMLPSINQMSTELGYARKTIDKAYGELKDRGLVESRNRRGFFVRTDSVDQTIRVALVLYEFRPFQEMFYNVFRQSVGENVQVDTFFHHNNLSVFEDIITKITGSYGLYIVAPIINQQVPIILGQLINNRLLLVDRFVDLGPDRPHVIQEFEESTFNMLSGLLERIRAYKRIEIFFRQDTETAYPLEILSACRRFCSRNGVKLKVHDRYVAGSLEREVLYLTIGDNDLWSLLEDCIDRGYELGKDLGILSHNESRIKKIVHGGISTWSTDFGQMAEEAARFVLERKPERTTIPTVFIDRGSF
jgi:DNA-binding transcriptional regulator YhcF (GntR family)/DNA-binding LacI/PurR family transcriptional regulator